MILWHYVSPVFEHFPLQRRYAPCISLKFQLLFHINTDEFAFQCIIAWDQASLHLPSSIQFPLLWNPTHGEGPSWKCSVLAVSFTEDPPICLLCGKTEVLVVAKYSFINGIKQIVQWYLFHSIQRARASVTFNQNSHIYFLPCLDACTSGRLA